MKIPKGKRFQVIAWYGDDRVPTLVYSDDAEFLKKHAEMSSSLVGGRYDVWDHALQKIVYKVGD